MRIPAFLLVIMAILFTVPFGGRAAAQVAPAATATSDQGTQADQAALPAESARTLIEVIENPESRAALIDLLRRAADPALAPAQDAAGAAADTAPPAQTPDESSQTARMATGISDYAQHVAETAGFVARRTISSFRGLAAVATGETAVDWQRFGQAALRLAIVALVTFAAYFLVRLVIRRLFSAVARVASGRTIIGTFIGLVALALIDEAAVVIAWAAGYAFALFTGAAGNIDVNQSLFLNAFLLIETIKVVLRMVFTPTEGDLRLVPMKDATAGYLYFWCSRLVSFLGYGFLLFVPIVNLNVSFFAARGLRVLIALVAAITAIVVILVNRKPAAAAIHRFGHRMGSFGRGMLAVVASVWHLLAILYVAVFFTIWLSRPGDALAFMIGATLQSLAAVVVAAVVMTLIARTIAGGVHVPEDIKARLPLLQDRLNRLVPTILKVVRIVLMICVVIAVLHAWQVIDALAWVDSQAGGRFVAGLGAAAAVILVSLAAWLALSSWIDYRLNPAFGTVPTARERTLLSLFRNAATIAIALFGSMIALSEIGVDIGPLLAGAGVIGLAIGFGAQKLVQDIITGIFIQFENAVNEGDVVTLGGISGVVEKLTVRSVSLRDLDGVFHIIPFSSVDSVSNYMRGFAYHKAEIGVAYRENIAEVKRHMHIAFDRLMETDHAPSILEPLEMHGVTQFGDSAVVVRARIKTRPGDQWAVGRAYNEIIKEVFDEAGIEIPFPHMTLWWGEDKTGNAPPLHIRRDGEGGNGGGTGNGTPAPARTQRSPEVGTEHSADVTADDDT